MRSRSEGRPPLDRRPQHKPPACRSSERGNHSMVGGVPGRRRTCCVRGVPKGNLRPRQPLARPHQPRPSRNVRTIMSDRRQNAPARAIGHGLGPSRRADSRAGRNKGRRCAVAAASRRASTAPKSNPALDPTAGKRTCRCGEVNEAAHRPVAEGRAHPEANIIFGAMVDEGPDRPGVGHGSSPPAMPTTRPRRRARGARRGAARRGALPRGAQHRPRPAAPAQHLGRRRRPHPST